MERSLPRIADGTRPRGAKPRARDVGGAPGAPSWAAALVVALAMGVATPGVARTGFLDEVGEWVAHCDNTGECALANRSTAARDRTSSPSRLGMSHLCLLRPARAGAFGGFVSLLTLGPRDPAAPPPPAPNPAPTPRGGTAAPQ